MSSSLSSLVHNLSEVFHNYECKHCQSCLDYISTKDSQLIFKCTKCSKKHKGLIKRFENTYEFCDRDIDKLILLLRKGVYQYEYMNSWQRFDEELLPDRKAFHSSLNMEDITDVDYRHAKEVCKEFNSKNLGDYHELLC